MIILIDRILSKIKRAFRKAVFRKKIKCPHKEFSLVGDITLINKNIHLGKNVWIYPDVMFFGDGDIFLGDNVDIGNGTVLYASKDGGIKIGNNSIIAAQCYIIDMDHGIEGGRLIREQGNVVKKVEIGEDVWIGAGCKILKGSTINDGSVIGAQSVVKGDIPKNAVAVGVPAKIIKNRE